MPSRKRLQPGCNKTLLAFRVVADLVGIHKVVAELQSDKICNYPGHSPLQNGCRCLRDGIHLYRSLGVLWKGLLNLERALLACFVVRTVCNWSCHIIVN